jgi:lipopolysaccharide export system protein LptA
MAVLSAARAQFGNFGDFPVEITADGNTRFDQGVAIAEDNVQIHYGKYSIFCDYAEYNPDTRDVPSRRKYQGLHAGSGSKR